MKRHALSLVLLSLCLWLSSCGTEPATDPLPSASNQAPATMTAEVLAVSDNTVLLAQSGDGADENALFTIPLTTPFSPDGSTLSDGTLIPGMTIEVGHSGNVLETFPAQLDPLWYRITSPGDGFLPLVLNLLDQLMEEDSALQEGCIYLAFDLTQADNLTAAQKSGIIWLLSSQYQLESLEGTMDTLTQQGYIDQASSSFPEGVLLTLSTTQQGDNAFSYTVSKWRGGDGAIGIDGQATRIQGIWTPSNKTQWIS